MPKEVGGGPKIAGDDKREVVKFHEELTEDRVHSLRDLKAVLEPFEESFDFQRQNLPHQDLDEYLTHEENKHWGNPRYEFNSTIASDVVGYLSLQYSPWLNEEKDVLIQGRAGLEGYGELEEPIPAVDKTAEAYPGQSEYVEFISEGDDFLWISVPTDPERPIVFPDHLKSQMQIGAFTLQKYD